MIYKFILLSDEVDNFMREIQIDSEATFMELHDAILDSVKYGKDQITSFFVCNEDWEKEQEITQIEMDTSSEYDNYVMDETKLEELLSDEGQKLLFVFDMMNERSFFIELRETIPGMDLPMAKCTASKGTAPKQILDDLFADLAAASSKGGDAAFGFEEDFNDDDFDEEELDDLNISDDYFSEQNF
ncbi:MAG: hypothetical protein J5554_08905 [Paludibacteraceae bacterium]|nr:hypothetical protein [Paludibacteraceae bacterium]